MERNSSVATHATNAMTARAGRLSGAAVKRPQITDALARTFFEEWARVGYSALSLDAVARKAGVGKLVGTKTWGGLVGIGGYPSLLDGGFVMAPRYAIYGLNGDWEVENRGIAPDVPVEESPKDFVAGHDRQLETGVQLVLDELKANPIPSIPMPPYPNYHKNDGLGKE